MNHTIQECVYLLELLPEKEQELALTFIQKLVLAWDPNYTKVSINEKNALNMAEQELKNKETTLHNEIDWN